VLNMSMQTEVPGRGRKRPSLDIKVERLELDPSNPRLPKDLRDKDQNEILSILRRYFDLDELAYSMAENGYFDEEPLVAVPINIPPEFTAQDPVQLSHDGSYLAYLQDDSTKLTVVEGNRRLATVKLLLSTELRAELGIRGWPSISPEVREDLVVLPVIIYSSRPEVLRYMGVRHIAGIKKWESFSKAIYVAEMVNEGTDIKEIQQQVGDRSNSVRKLFLSYKLIDMAETELAMDITRAKEYFSYLILAIGQRPVKEFLGIPNRLTDVNFDEPIATGKDENLKYLISWLFGEGKEKPPIVRESRDITSYLTPVLRSAESIEHLIATRNLMDAYDRSEGEKLLLLRNLKRASKNLSSSLGLITKYKSEEDVKQEINNCQDILSDISKLTGE